MFRRRPASTPAFTRVPRSPVALAPAGGAAVSGSRSALRAVTEVCEAVAAGDTERRVPVLGDDPDAVAAREAVNSMLDVVDGYLRESAGSVHAWSRGELHRRLLHAGLLGQFERSAVVVDAGRAAMMASQDRLAQAATAREALAEDLESTVLQVSAQLAAAATEMGATAENVVAFAREAVTDASRASGTMDSLRTSSDQIRRAVDLITQVAAQTRLLALNATIEAARAGDAGRGFSVVASEVKALADEAARSTSTIAEAVTAVQAAASGAASALDAVTQRIREMDAMVNDIATAVDGGTSAAAYAGGSPYGTGLVGLAEMLRHEVDRFVLDVRGSED